MGWDGLVVGWDGSELGWDGLGWVGVGMGWVGVGMGWVGVGCSLPFGLTSAHVCVCAVAESRRTGRILPVGVCVCVCVCVRVRSRADQRNAHSLTREATCEIALIEGNRMGPQRAASGGLFESGPSVEWCDSLVTTEGCMNGNIVRYVQLLGSFQRNLLLNSVMFL